MRTHRILFIYTGLSTFVQNDMKILQKHARVLKYHYRSSKYFWTHLFSQVRLYFWLMGNLKGADKIYCWFADYHSLLPTILARIFRKEIFIVLGGYDVIHIPELGYGSFKNSLRGFCASYSMRYATLNLAVSNYVYYAALKLVPAAKIVTVYNGVNVHYGEAVNSEKREWVLTVGVVDTWQRIYLKGIDFFCNLSKFLPEYTFIAIGISKKARRFIDEIPENLIIKDKVTLTELRDYYGKSRVYCQFSRIESFGMSLVEAMLCGCIPIGMASGAMPEVIGDTGYILKAHDIELAKWAVKQAMSAGSEKAIQASNRIRQNFSLEKREQRLQEVLKLC